ncbi:MAG: GAF domain-containing protein, partial [Chloroflexota bacterium]
DDRQQVAEAVLVEYLGVIGLKQGGVLIFDEDLVMGTLIGLMRAGELAESGLRIPVSTNPATMKMIETQKPVIVNDAINDPLLEPIRDLVYELKYQSLLLVPIMIQGRVIGALGADGIERQHFFREQEVGLVQAVADTLSIALQNQQLLEQTRRALSETEQLYGSSISLSAAASYEEILQGLVKVINQQDMNEAYLYLIDLDHMGKPEWLEVSAYWHRNDQISSFPVGTRFYLPEFSMSDLWVDSPDDVLLVENTLDDERIDENARQIFQQTQAYATIVLPLRLGEKWIGLANFSWTSAQTFNQADGKRYASFSAQAAVVLNNQLLLEQTKAALSETEQLYQANAALNASESYNEILDVVRRYTRAKEAESVSIGYFGQDVSLSDSFPDTFEILASWRPRVSEVFKIHYSRDELPSIEQIIQPRLVTYKDIQTEQLGYELRAVYEEANIVSAIYAPIATAGQWLGFLSILFSSRIDFSEAELQRISSLAGQLSIAVQNLYNLNRSQKQAKQEQVLQEITAQVRNSLDPETIVQTTVRSLGEVLGRDVFVSLQSKEVLIDAGTPTKINGVQQDQEK